MARQQSQEAALRPQPFSVEAKKTVLIIVDMQNDFVEEKGSLYNKTSADLTPRLNSLIKKARDREVPVIYTQDWHMPNDIEFKLWPRHCVKGTWGAELTDQLAREKNDILVKKGTIDPWLKSTLAGKLKETGAQSLIVTGTVANICVLHTVAGGVIRGLKVVVPDDCVAPLAPTDLKPALRQFKQVYKCDITRSKLLSFQR